MSPANRVLTCCWPRLKITGSGQCVRHSLEHCYILQKLKEDRSGMVHRSSVKVWGHSALNRAGVLVGLGAYCIYRHGIARRAALLAYDAL